MATLTTLAIAFTLAPPPPTRTEPVTETLHGEQFVDETEETEAGIDGGGLFKECPARPKNCK